MPRVDNQGPSLVQLIPHHVLTDNEELLYVDQFKSHISNLPVADFDLYVKLSDNQQMRAPRSMYRNEVYSFALISQRTTSVDSISVRLVYRLNPYDPSDDRLGRLDDLLLTSPSETMGNVVSSCISTEETASQFRYRQNSEEPWQQISLSAENRHKTLRDLGIVGGAEIEIVIDGGESNKVYFKKGSRHAEFGRGEKLQDVLAKLDIKEEKDISDLRIRSKSLYSQIIGNICECEDTLKKLKISGGDVIDVTLKSMETDHVSHRWKCTSLGASTSMSNFDINRRENVGSIRERLCAEADMEIQKNRYSQPFTRQRIKVNGEDRELLRPLHDVDKSSACMPLTRGVDIDKNDIEAQGHLEILANPTFLEWETKTEIPPDAEWSWGLEKYRFWVSGVAVSDKKGANDTVYAVRLQDETFSDFSGNTYKDVAALRDSKTIEIPSEDRVLCDFIAFIQDFTQFKMKAQADAYPLLFERLKYEDVTKIENLDRCAKTFLCDDFWISGTRQRLEDLQEEFSKMCLYHATDDDAIAAVPPVDVVLC